MSINEQIQAAWKVYKPEALSTNSMALSHDVFTAGYLAALRRLYVEVKPEEMKLETTYLFWIDGQWREERCVLVELLELLARKAEKILKLSLPSPSDIFGRG